MPDAPSARSRLAGRLRRGLDRFLLTSWRAVLEFIDDRGHRDAAQIAFFTMLAAVPLGLLLVGAFGLMFGEAEVRERVVTIVFDNVPLATEVDHDRIERTVVDALGAAGSLRPFPVLLLLAAASGMMGALRHAINQAWDIHERPPLLRRKALDLVLVLGATLLLVLSISVTATRRAADLVSEEQNGGWLAAAVLDAIGDVLPFLFTAATILFFYRVLPMHRPRVREIWPGALVAAALITLVRGALEIYFEHFADFGALYGSLGALMALLLFVFAASNVLVFGAEFASEYARLPGDDEIGRTVARGRRRVVAALRSAPGALGSRARARRPSAGGGGPPGGGPPG